MSLLPEIDLEDHPEIEQEEMPRKKFVMTKKFVTISQSNSIQVPNNEEGYKHYFSVGGTVGKMDIKTTIRYMRYKREKQSA